MKTVTIQTLESIGISLLTGEACAFSMRVLCDVNQKGKELIEDFLGVTLSKEPWNSRVNNFPSVNSFMLSRETIDPLVRFSLFRDKYKYVYGQNAAYTGFNEEDIPKHPFLEMVHSKGTSSFAPGLLYRNPNVTGVSRNIHQFTGRTE